MGSWKGRGNQYIEFARVVYCKLPTNGKQLPAFPLKAVTGIEPRPQRWDVHLTNTSTMAPLLDGGNKTKLNQNMPRKESFYVEVQDCNPLLKNRTNTKCYKSSFQYLQYLHTVWPSKNQILLHRLLFLF